MSYLLVQMAVLMLLATLLGGMVAWWLAKQRIADLLAERTRLHEECAQWRRQIERQLAEPPGPDWTPVMHRLGALEKAIGSIRLPTPEPINLRPVLDAVASLRRPDLQPINLEPLHARLLALEDSIRRLHLPTPREADLQPLMASLLQLQRAVAALRGPSAPETDPGAPA